MDKLTKSLALALAMTAGSSWAADNSELDALRQQVTRGETQAAWQQAQQMRKQWESDTGFDYLYGLLAYDQGQYSEAQFALERVVLNESGNIQARLALAKAYLKLGDEHSARRQFDAVKQSSPPAHIMREVNHNLSQLGEGRTGSLGGFIEGGFGHDNNISSSTSSNVIPNPAFDPLVITSDPLIRLGKGSSQQSDMYEFLFAGLDYYQPLDAVTGVEARGRIGARNNFSSNDYDNNIYRGSVSLVHVVGDDQFRATLAAQDYRLSDSDYQDYYSLSGDWTRYNYGGWTLSGALFVNELRYSDDHLLDVYQYVGSFGAQRLFGAFNHGVGIVLGDENAQRKAGNHNARMFGGVFYDVNYDLSGGHQLFGRLYLQEGHQNARDPFFGEVRDETYSQVTAGWDWHISKPLRLRTELVYTDNDSNLDYYSYDRTRLQTGLRYSF